MDCSHIAAGVTTVRDMANDIDFLHGGEAAIQRRNGDRPARHRSRLHGRTGTLRRSDQDLVSSEDEVRTAIDRYKKLGYEQIKVYSSIRPELVPFITRSRMRTDCASAVTSRRHDREAGG